MATSELEEMFKGKYVEINYYDKEGKTVIVAGKLSKFKISMKDYSTCMLNPVVILSERGYVLKKTKKNIAYFIPPGALNRVEETTRGEILLKCCQINEENKNENPDRIVVQGFQLLKDRKNLENTCNPSD